MADRDAQGRLLPGNAYAWKKGESGNPSGRPKGLISRHMLEKLFADPDALDRITSAWLAVAAGEDKDSFQHLKLLLDRIDGVLSIKDVEDAHAGGLPAEVIVVDERTAAKFKREEASGAAQAEEGDG